MRLYNAAPSMQSASDLASIRSTWYMVEVSSGETLRKESGLRDMVLLRPAAQHLASSMSNEWTLR